MKDEYVGIYKLGDSIEIDKIIKSYEDKNGNISHDIEMYISGLISGNSRAVLTVLYLNKPLSLYMDIEFYKMMVRENRHKKLRDILK